MLSSSASISSTIYCSFFLFLDMNTTHQNWYDYLYMDTTTLIRSIHSGELKFVALCHTKLIFVNIWVPWSNG